MFYCFLEYYYAKVDVLAPTLDSCFAVYAPLTPYFCDGK